MQQRRAAVLPPGAVADIDHLSAAASRQRRML